MQGICYYERKIQFCQQENLSIILRIERNHIHSRRGNEQGLPARLARPAITIWAIYFIVPGVQ